MTHLQTALEDDEMASLDAICFWAPPLDATAEDDLTDTEEVRQGVGPVEVWNVMLLTRN